MPLYILKVETNIIFQCILTKKDQTLMLELSVAFRTFCKTVFHCPVTVYWTLCYSEKEVVASMAEGQILIIQWACASYPVEQESMQSLKQKLFERK